MDLSDYLKLDLQGFYKTQGQTFGKRTTIEVKSRDLKNQRKDLRSRLVCEKRKINSNMSPYVTPAPRKNSTESNKDKVNKRYEMLLKWKEEKLKKQLESKAKTRPIFKVTHIPTQTGLPHVDSVNKVIKGKPIKIEDKGKKKCPPMKSEFAPKNHKFRGPQNIVQSNNKVPVIKQENIVPKASTKSIDKVVVPHKKVTMNEDIAFITPKKQTKTYKKTPAKLKSTKSVDMSNNKENVETNRNVKEYDLRNRKIAVFNDNKQTKRINKIAKPNEHSNKIASTAVNSKTLLSSSHSTIHSSDEHIDSSQNMTPHKKSTCSESEPIVYISPFVTINRGKNSARKEFHSRKSKGGLCESSPDIESSTGPKAGAAYFRRLLESEILRIEGLCNDWNLYKDNQKPPEEACDMINVAIGQSQLLLQKKFKQFRTLINSCENGDSDMVITCEDLHGYWDTAYIQVENLNMRFENLNKLRSNNWEEIIPKKKTTNVKKVPISKPKVQASSSLRDAIRAARDRAKGKATTNKLDNETANTFDGGFFSIVSPTKTSKSPSRMSTRKKRSLLVDVLNNQCLKRPSSPGLVMLKAAQLAKSTEKESSNTPSRSILKSRRSKSSTKRAKSVLFKEDCVDNVPIGKLISIDSEDDTPRKSLRTSRRIKLF